MYLRCIVVCQDCLPSRLDLTKLVQLLIVLVLVSSSQYKRNLQKCDHLFNMVMHIYMLQKQLGYSNHIFRLSQLHQCDQGMLLNWFIGKASSLFTLVSEDLFDYSFLAFLPQTTQSRNSGHEDV